MNDMVYKTTKIVYKPVIYKMLVQF